MHDVAMSEHALSAFLAQADAFALVEIVAAFGSTPRESGTWMLVTPDGAFGTIGGGRLEFLAIEKARELITLHVTSGALSIPLGPEIGQCCGGRVELAIQLGDDQRRRDMLARAQSELAVRPEVFVFGGGHVGYALAAALVLLPLKVTIVETRAKMLITLPKGVQSCLTSVPEQVVRKAPEHSAFVVLTHDHALDFLIVTEALQRTGALYVGMIGSRTKRATYKNWFLREVGANEMSLSRLVCPIGGEAVRDKRPAVIAAFAAAEIARALFSDQ